MKKRFIDILNDQIIENLPKETTAFLKGGSDDAPNNGCPANNTVAGCGELNLGSCAPNTLTCVPNNPLSCISPNNSPVCISPNSACPVNPCAGNNYNLMQCQ